jgi:tRNA (guanine26-N2/guanine27-N2)-dimethyltransferase
LLFSFPTEEITEGAITFTVPKLSMYAKGTTEYIPSKAPVFYNPRMSLNRDIAVLALRIYQRTRDKTLRICDPLTGCGVRGLRFAREVDDVDFVVLNDRNSQAARLTRFNAEKNKLLEKVVVKNMDARTLLGRHVTHKGFDVIDVDPYGSSSPFLDAALIAIRNKGLLALTATDTAPLCGVNPKACFRKYFGKPLRTEYCHELALRRR